MGPTPALLDSLKLAIATHAPQRTWGPRGRGGAQAPAHALSTASRSVCAPAKAPPLLGHCFLDPVAGPYIVYMLQEIDILEDWTAIKKARAAVSPQKRKSDGP